MHAPPSTNPLLTAPILPTLTRLSLPNMAAMLAAAGVAVAETVYVGALGTPALAGLALVFPMVMLQQMMSGGAMGGGVTSAVSRALGAGNDARAEALAFHAAAIAVITGLAFTVFFMLLGPALYRLLGGNGAPLAEALAYSNVIFIASAAIWLANLLASVLRGSGNMKAPSTILFAIAGAQVILGGSLGLGLGPMPRLGMAGVALGQALAYGGGALVLVWLLMSGRTRVTLKLTGIPFQREMFMDIFKVGAVSCISSLQTVLTVLIVTRLVAAFGVEALAGYGIGARLEFLLIPITFAIGVASVPMVGMAIGAGDGARAQRVAWTSGGLAAATVGMVGLAVAIVPDLWATLFTNNAAVLDAARSYLRFAGPAYAFFGLGLCLYFAAQGSGSVVGPVLAGTLRLVIIALGGWWLTLQNAQPWTMFALVAFGMVIYGLATAFSIWRVRWGKS